MKLIITGIVALLWSLGITDDPQTSVLATWFAWATICLSIAISARKDKSTMIMWGLFVLIDLIQISLTLYLGGRNWGLDDVNKGILVTGCISLFISINWREKEKISAWVGAIALICAYIPLLKYWWEIDSIAPSRMMWAVGLSIIPPLMDSVDLWKKSKRFQPGNIISCVCSGICLMLMFWTEKREPSGHVFAPFFMSFSHLKTTQYHIRRGACKQWGEERKVIKRILSWFTKRRQYTPNQSIIHNKIHIEDYESVLLKEM